MKDDQRELSAEEKLAAKKNLFALGLLFLVIAFIYFTKLWIDYDYNADFEIKKEAFKNNKELLCKPMLSGKTYLVSKDNAWSIHNKYFKKDDLLLEINSCKEEK